MAQGRNGAGGRRRGQETDQAALIAGPKKQRPPDGYPERHTTHKTRSAWFQARATWPLREAPVHDLVAEHARVSISLAPPPAATQWELVGPTNIGGRMTSIVCDPANPDVIWAGAAGGGVWKSDDGGQHWRALWHKQPTLNIGALAIDPTHKTLYCGTGEANLSANSYPESDCFARSMAVRIGKYLLRRHRPEFQPGSVRLPLIRSTPITCALAALNIPRPGPTGSSCRTMAG